MQIDAIAARMAKLYNDELERNFNPYLVQHGDRNSIRRHARVFKRYVPYLPESGTILDWGCRHAPDACMIRAAFGDQYELHGCDFPTSGSFPTFHAFADLKFTTIDHIYALPYEDNSISAVIGSGVLEHTAMDYESLKEIHRVLEPDGTFVVTFLPNRYSLAELISRLAGLPSHRRRYGRAQIRTTLMHYGFEPLLSSYHQFTPAHFLHTLSERLSLVNTVGERLWPFNRFCTTIMIVARKRLAM